MDNQQVAEYITALKYGQGYVRQSAAHALGEIGDASAVPALVEALKDEKDYVRHTAAEALGKLGDASAVPALIAALKYGSQYEYDPAAEALHRYAVETLGKIGVLAVPALIAAWKGGCWQAATALRKIGDLRTLPRKILASTQFSIPEKIEVLDALHRSRIRIHGYKFPETRALCQKVLNEPNTEARNGAEAVLDWMDNGSILVRASQRDTASDPQELLRASQGGAPAARTETLLRASEESEQDAPKTIQHRTRWDWLFQKRKDTDQ